MSRLAVPATIEGTSPSRPAWRSSEPVETNMRQLSPGSYRLFGLLCQAATARSRRPITWPQLKAAHHVAVALTPDAPPEDRNGLDPFLAILGLDWPTVLDLAREAGLEIFWTD